ncbi:hypothetical protein HN51_055364 [Arachis hypogaea]
MHGPAFSFLSFPGCLTLNEREKERQQLASRKEEKADQLLPANDPIKFANRYCELKYPMFATSRNLYLERTLKIREELQQYTSDQIKQRGWFFLERNLTEVNASWVREFYCNYFKTSLDAVHLRGK